MQKPPIKDPGVRSSEQALSEDKAMERADKAIKELLKQKPETHEQMVERRRRKSRKG